MRALSIFGVLGVLLVGCGGSDNPNDDGSHGCDYDEAADATNGTDAEASNLSITGTDQRVICGQVDVGHFDAGAKTVDVDKFRVTTDGMFKLLVRGWGGAGVETAGELSFLVFDTNQNPTLIAGASELEQRSDHAAFFAELPAGTYDVVVVAKNSADLAAGFKYSVRFSPDDGTRAPAIADTADYTEAADGDGTGNDLVSYGGAAAPWAMTDAATDAAEPTALKIQADGYRITGSAAMVNASDEYMDRDTYLVTTDEKVNELTLRLDWLDQGTDLDVAVFEADSLNENGESLFAGSIEEYVAIPVKPQSSYWIWVGAHDGSSVLPEAYDLSVWGTIVTFED